MSRLAKAIRLFCVPVKVVWKTIDEDEDGPITRTLECRSIYCGENSSLELPTKKKYKHYKECQLTLLRKMGDTKALLKKIAYQAHYLNYDGGGHSSCSICGGGTGFRGRFPRHSKNCPGGIAHREWFSKMDKSNDD